MANEIKPARKGEPEVLWINVVGLIVGSMFYLFYALRKQPQAPIS